MSQSLLFVSPVFLFPASTGGRIRTSQILRGMKGGPFEITLVSPAAKGAQERHADELDSVCDRFVSWPAARKGALFRAARWRHLLSAVPVPVATDRSAEGLRVVARELDRAPDVVVFDFLHAAILAPPEITPPSVLFTHNVEAEIFRRQRDMARSALVRRVWENQLSKMARFERDAVRQFDTVVAVSERDGRHFRDECGARNVAVIPTGVDLDHFTYHEPGDGAKVVFTGSMDWLPNVDGMTWLLEEVWPLVAARRPDASMTVIGRDPPERLVRRAAGAPWRFTGFVDDVREWMQGAAAYVIPLRVGGGTRIKAYEAMAYGTPVVSTTLGVEGLPVEPDRHYLRADAPEEFAAALLRLLEDAALRKRLSAAARDLVESRFSSRRVAEVFQKICLRTANGDPVPA